MSTGYDPITDDEVTLLENLMPQDLFSVYSGRVGKCCCGCSGKHTYFAANRVAAGLNRGYEVDNEDIGDRTVVNILRRLQRAVAADRASVNAGDNHFAIDVGQRVYIVYMAQEVERQRCQTCDALAISTYDRPDGTRVCRPCWVEALRYGHIHTDHDTIVRDCPVCNSAEGVF